MASRRVANRPRLFGMRLKIIALKRMSLRNFWRTTVKLIRPVCLVKDLYPTYEKYCEEHKIRKGLSRPRFNEDLLGRPGIKKAQIGKNRGWTWQGIGFKTQSSDNVTRGDFGRIDPRNHAPVAITNPLPVPLKKSAATLQRADITRRRDMWAIFYTS